VTRMSPVGNGKLKLRSRVRPADVDALRQLVAATGVFRAEERAVALELLELRLAQGAASGYSFFFADIDGELAGYCAWGRVPMTQSSYDLYWIAVAPSRQGLGVGRALLARTERAIARNGGRLYIETSSRAAYERTRRFYRSAGYRQVARLKDFYASGDDKVVYCKAVPARGPRV